MHRYWYLIAYRADVDSNSWISKAMPFGPMLLVGSPHGGKVDGEVPDEEQSNQDLNSGQAENDGCLQGSITTAGKVDGGAKGVRIPQVV